MPNIKLIIRNIIANTITNLNATVTIFQARTIRIMITRIVNIVDSMPKI